MKRTMLVVILGILWAGLAYAVECGSVTFLVGKAQKMDLGNGKWEELKYKEKLSDNTRIRTAKASTLKIKLLDDSVITLGESAVFDMATVAAKPGQPSSGEFNVLYGKVRAVVTKVKDGKNDYRFSTPTAVAGVRGTDLGIEVKGAEQSKFVVFEGEIEVKSRVKKIGDKTQDFKPVVLKENQKTEIVTATVDAQVVEMEKAEQAQWDFNLLAERFKTMKAEGYVDTKAIYRDDRRF